MRKLTEQHGVKLRRFPDEVLAALRKRSATAIEALAAADPVLGRVYPAYTSYAAAGSDRHEYSEGLYGRVSRS